MEETEVKRGRGRPQLDRAAVAPFEFPGVPCQSCGRTREQGAHLHEVTLMDRTTVILCKSCIRYISGRMHEKADAPAESPQE